MSLIDDARAHLRLVPDPQPSHAPEPEREFSVIEGGIDRAVRALRFLGVTLAATMIVGLVGVLAVHATIIKTQRDLDTQQRRIDTIAAETEGLRHELAELEAPARVVAEAHELGMIEAPAVTYLHVQGGLLEERTLQVAENQLAAG